MSSATRTLLVWLAAAACAGAARAEPLYILAVGETLASNCHAQVFPAESGVYQLGPEGEERPAADPLGGADCTRGSVWMPLGRRLREARHAEKVVFLPVGAEGTRMADWLGKGAAQARLAAALRMARAKHIRFDYVLWLQGASDRGSDPRRYQQGLGQVLKQIRLGVVDAGKILVARHSGCGGQSDPALRHAQAEFARNAHLRIFPGPDADAVGTTFRSEACQLDPAGQEEMARRWAEAIDAADKASTAIRKETLLYWF